MNDIDRAQQAYRAYGQVTDFKDYQGLPMPEWGELTPKIQEAWVAAANASRNNMTAMSNRELTQIMHAKAYAAHYSLSGATGHGGFLLIAVLAEALGL